jgi:hypothetical protein
MCPTHRPEDGNGGGLATLACGCGSSALHHRVDRPMFAAALLARRTVAAEPPPGLGAGDGLEADRGSGVLIAKRAGFVPAGRR